MPTSMTQTLPRHRPRTLAFVSDAIYPYNKGGKETRLYEVTTRLAQRGYDVHVYCMKWWPSSENTRVENGVTLHAICPFIPLYSGERRSIKQGVLFGLACFSLIGAKFDVVEVDHMPYFPLYSMRLVCWLKGKKLFATWHEVWGFEYWKKYMGWSGYVAGAIEIIAMKLPDTFFSISEHTANRLKEFVPPTKVVTIPLGVALENIDEVTASPIKSDVIFAGRLLTHKNVDMLIEAVAGLVKKKPKLRCIIVGNGPEEKNLKKLSQSLKLSNNIIFKDFCQSKTELYSLIKSSKCLVLMSDREGFGLIVIEANALGVPVITTNLPENAAKDLIENNLNGYLVDLNVNALKSSLESLLSKSLQSSLILKEKCIEYATKYSWNNTINKMEKFL